MTQKKSTKVGKVKKITSILKKTIEIYFDADAPLAAAAISFYGFLGTVPFLLLFLSVVGFVCRKLFHLTTVDISLEISNFFGPYGERIFSLVNSVFQRTVNYGILGLVGMFLAFSAVVTPVDWALKKVFKGETTRSFLFQRAVSFLLFVLIITGSFLIAGATTVFQIFQIVVNRVQLLDKISFFNGTLFFQILISALQATLIAIASFLLMWILPAKKPDRTSIMCSALFSGIAIEAGRQIFLSYLKFIPVYDVIYGAAGFLIALMIFIYLSASLFLVGAALAEAISLQRWGIN